VRIRMERERIKVRVYGKISGICINLWFNGGIDVVT